VTLKMEDGFDAIMASLERVVAQPERISLPGVFGACATLTVQDSASLFQFGPP
jgi:hypothetical protein